MGGCLQKGVNCRVTYLSTCSAWFFPCLQTYLTVLSEDHVSWSYFKDRVPQSTFGISL